MKSLHPASRPWAPRSSCSTALLGKPAVAPARPSVAIRSSGAQFFLGAFVAMALVASLGANPPASGGGSGASGNNGGGSGGRVYPSAAYFTHLPLLYAGDYGEALTAFKGDL